jgi:thioesterase domain-containing protein
VAYYVGAAEVAASELRAFLGQRLPEYMVPSAFVPLAAMPLSPSGKVDRKALPAPDVRGALGGARVAPRDANELVLWNLWREILGSVEFGVTDSFFELGGHSLAVIRLAGRVQETFGVQLAVKTVMANPTVETLAAALGGATSSGRRSPIVPIQPSGTQTPLFLVHPASGTVICYCALANHLGRARPIYGLQAAGIEDGLEPISDLQVMASEYVQAVRETQPGGPYLIAGWSAGGHIAFEMANQLAAQGQRVGFLGLLDSSALLYGDRTPPRDERTVLAELLGEQLGLVTHQDLQGLSLDQQIERAVPIARERNLLPQSFTTEQAHRFLGVYRATRRAVGAFVPLRFPGDVTLIRSASLMEGEIRKDPRHGWDRFVEGSIRILDTPGDHETLIREPNCRTLAGHIEDCLRGL